MDVKKLVINALLAGLWAGLASLQATGEVSKASILAAAAVALRACVGFLAAYFKAPVPVDK